MFRFLYAVVNIKCKSLVEIFHLICDLKNEINERQRKFVRVEEKEIKILIQKYFYKCK